MNHPTEHGLHPYQFCPSLTRYARRKTIPVNIGGIYMGSDYPIRVQSMTTIDTMDTQGSIEQTIRLVEAGCDYVRITAPSMKEAENLGRIRQGLRERGYDVPLIADIHFTPNAAELAARLVEKVRINPGNYVDKKKFELIEYDDASYQAEIERIREKFIPLIKICKEYGTAMRIGTNHGSLSDRIMSRYGDTPLGMVESAMEFLRICDEFDYHQVVLSMKASNTQVMVQAYRLLVQQLDAEGLRPYPLHLGVTEAGDGEDGRIKSAVGIGTLLEDGLGDTVRVSLTEEPELEAPVAQALIDRYALRGGAEVLPPIDAFTKDPFQYARRNTREVANFGASNVPRVIADLSRTPIAEMKDLKPVGHFYLPELDKWGMGDQGCDYIYAGKNKIPFMLPNGVKEILDYAAWARQPERERQFPWHTKASALAHPEWHPALNFLELSLDEWEPALQPLLEAHPVVLVLRARHENAMQELRRFFFELERHGVTAPAAVRRDFPELPSDRLQLYAATDIGGLLIDGFGDGAMLGMEQLPQEACADKALLERYNATAFGILQAARTRMTKTEYISCPSCGRTLFDLQETTAMIRKRTDHLKGVKIGIMGCIVNGPGEMADADYGYVGSGKGKITLYKGQEVMKRNVPSDRAVDELIDIIRADGNWIEPANR